MFALEHITPASGDSLETVEFNIYVGTSPENTIVVTNVVVPTTRTAVMTTALGDITSVPVEVTKSETGTTDVCTKLSPYSAVHYGSVQSIYLEATAFYDSADPESNTKGLKVSNSINSMGLMVS
ncbi:MAG: hypothetical protein EOM68_31440 [Spirochaetia bacterium]|nr:hypothetical protein [Spirochaetia bacterium]